MLVFNCHHMSTADRGRVDALCRHASTADRVCGGVLCRHTLTGDRPSVLRWAVLLLDGGGDGGRDGADRRQAAASRSRRAEVG